MPRVYKRSQIFQIRIKRCNKIRYLSSLLNSCVELQFYLLDVERWRMCTLSEKELICSGISFAIIVA